MIKKSLKIACKYFLYGYDEIMLLKRKFRQYENDAIALRKAGKTYGQIREILGIPIPKSTLSNWSVAIPLSPEERTLLDKNALRLIENGHKKGRLILRARRTAYLEAVRQKVVPLKSLLSENVDVAKISLAMLYWCEGSKTNSASLAFGNSHPGIIGLFLSLLRRCYMSVPSRSKHRGFEYILVESYQHSTPPVLSRQN